MPELPEVENLRRGLERNILGQKIKSVKVTKPKLVSGRGTLRTASIKKANEFTKELIGECFVAVDRRAKNLIFKLTHNKILLAHLKMTGQFVYEPKNGKKIIGGHPIELSEKTLPNKHTHIIFELEKGTLYYNDTRMFGYVVYYPSSEAFKHDGHFEKLGVEPMDPTFTPRYLFESLKNKKSKIKAILLGQDIVVGVGNIYADESLFEAGVSPERPGGSLSEGEATRLHKAIKRILSKAIKVGGSSVATYRLLDQSRGNYAREHKVYGKKGAPCVKCAKPLKRILIQARTTIFCPKCQT